MSQNIVIHFVGRALCEVSRVRNFAEELQGEIERRSIGTTANPDSVTDVFRIVAGSSRHLGDVNRIINQQLKKHMLVDEVHIERE